MVTRSWCRTVHAVDGWRLIAAALIAAGGLVLVLLTMAKTRERRGATGGTVALVGTITFTALAVLCVLVATVLPAWLVWTAVVLVGATVSVMMLAS
jgi:3,4-dihydroxy-2-butanone 4-phosphate synthase